MMRIANLSGRAALVTDSTALDVEQGSAALFGANPQAIWDDWSGFRAWADAVDVDGHPLGRPFEVSELAAPVPRPSQIFAIGLNYADHAAESGLDAPENPLVFTKFASSLTGADVTVTLTGDRVDWEAELVVVVGIGGRDLAESRAWDAVAGLTVGQDLSDRTIQSWGKPAQFSLGKSCAGYAPTGPAVVTVDEVGASHDPDALRVQCRISETTDGEEQTLQDGTTADLLFSVPELMVRLSRIVELRPGDLIFTGTPAGVGLGRSPQVFLKPGQHLVTEIEGLGRIRQEFA